MDEFTVEETDRINLLYGTDFKDATPDDFKLIQRWEAYRASVDAEFTAKREMMEAEFEEKTRIATEQARHAMNALDELKEAALARLKAVENG